MQACSHQQRQPGGKLSLQMCWDSPCSPPVLGQEIVPIVSGPATHRHGLAAVQGMDSCLRLCVGGEFHKRTACPERGRTEEGSSFGHRVLGQGMGGLPGWTARGADSQKARHEGKTAHRLFTQLGHPGRATRQAPGISLEVDMPSGSQPESAGHLGRRTVSGRGGQGGRSCLGEVRPRAQLPEGLGQPHPDTQRRHQTHRVKRTLPDTAAGMHRPEDPWPELLVTWGEARGIRVWQNQQTGYQDYQTQADGDRHCRQSAREELGRGGNGGGKALDLGERFAQSYEHTKAHGCELSEGAFYSWDRISKQEPDQGQEPWGRVLGRECGKGRHRQNSRGSHMNPKQVQPGRDRPAAPC